MAILANEKILTLDYWKPAYKVQPGDYVFNKDGKLVKVKLVQEYQAQSCYEVTFNDHLTAAGDSNLGFLVETPKYRIRVCTYQGKQRFRRPLKHFKTQDLVNAHLKDRRSRSLFSVPTARPLELPHQTLPVPPFIAGFWFFNQRANKKMAAPKGMAEVVHQQFKDHGYEITTGRRINTGEKEFSVFPTIESHFAPFIPTKLPENYILASVEQRIELLRGSFMQNQGNTLQEQILSEFQATMDKQFAKYRLLWSHWAVAQNSFLMSLSKTMYYFLRVK